MHAAPSIRAQNSLPPTHLAPQQNPTPLKNKQYASARANELARGKAQKHSVATKAHDMLEDLPELIDSRLAGWRVKTGGAAVGGEEEVVEDPVHVDQIKDASLPQQFDVVEYSLPQHALLEGDGRLKGVGVLLSNNRDRLDAATLPAEKMDLCQVEPLTLDPEREWSSSGGAEETEAVWKKDELEPRVFVPYHDLKKVKAHTNGMTDKWRRWRLEESLTEGCGAPAGAEEEPAIL